MLLTNSHSSNHHSSNHRDGEKAQLMASKVRSMMTKRTMNREVQSMMTMNPEMKLLWEPLGLYVEYRPVLHQHCFL